ncbi:aminopeptidase N [Flexivirga endophytica]|uniref:Aminopeptidase N n=1 Tax=Flexivirga endophytica TaxID=1849103 RepID=A0A916SUJ3_9MICO|nr:aminopeptidase N [Flexivirga endophytica]GGB16581.1 aminopeptidase N [Flexivirga endophytica]GHB38956.1 aminopeptidase N [Flexivirga endophytica]
MPNTNLTREEAQRRASSLAVESYDVVLDLTTGPETFRTTSRVRFTATDTQPTFIDFLGPSVESITLNGETIDPATAFDGARISLPELAEANDLTVVATGAYMNTGEGLHRFVDPTDNEVYLYTQFEVADSRRVFAVFEQPSLKATFAFTVTAPARWQLISNQPTPEPEAAAQTYTGPSGEAEPAATWRFEPTPRLSSYVTALVAGPYDVVRDEVQATGRTVPLAVYCRKSLREHLDADNLFAVTKKGFAFFEEQFGEPYPFAKYDQIFTPEYNAGAMENAGCVTITETYVFRTQVSDALIERRALTVLHELAHMWFGDLVTMQWWDDLWLNESFAEWASTWCQAEVTEWDTAWTTFSSSEKTWAYKQDQLSSTHPVYANMRHLEDVEANFDGITYAKGASVLKQLVAYVGVEPFVSGLRSYFAKFKWGNTTFDDLLGELEATSGRDLSTWRELWLKTSGANILRPIVEVDDAGIITRLQVQQTAPEGYPTLRPHRLAIGSYTLADGALTAQESVEVDVDGELTDVAKLVGKPMPDLLLVNDQDLTYAKVRLDPHSLETALANPTAITDSLARAVIFGALWDMTRDGELPPRQYIRYGVDALATETDSTLRQTMITQVTGATTAFLTSGAFGHTTSFLRPEHRAEAADEIATGFRKLMSGAEPGSDAQLQLTQAFARLARHDADVAHVRGLLEGTEVLEGLRLDTDMKWTLLTSLAAAGAATDAEVDAQLAADNTATGIARAAGARAAYPTAEAKAKAWHELVETDTLPNETARAVALGFGRVHDTTLLEPYVERYHAALREVWDARTYAMASNYVTVLYPIALSSQELIDATEQWLADNQDAPAGLVRLVAENRDIVRVALTAQSHDG